MRKVILNNWLSPGDLVMLTAAVRDLHLSNPNTFQTDVRTSCPALFDFSPWISKIEDSDSDAERIDCHYPLIQSSNQSAYHFIHGFRLYLEDTLGVRIKNHGFKGDIHLSDVEKSWLSQVDEITGTPNTPFWVVNAGHKNDFTAKMWSTERYQEVVDHFQGRIQFVQVGAAEHKHAPLNNVINLVGKTDIRQMIRLMYHAQGVVCPVTFHMHLAAAVPVRPDRPPSRPCVVIAGGREPSHWEAYPSHQFIHRQGMLPCCSTGGCWKSRVVPLNDGDQEKDQSLCLQPVEVAPSRFIPRCLDMIKATDVIRAIEGYLQYGEPNVALPRIPPQFAQASVDQRSEEPGESRAVCKTYARRPKDERVPRLPATHRRGRELAVTCAEDQRCEEQ